MQRAATCGCAYPNFFVTVQRIPQPKPPSSNILPCPLLPPLQVLTASHGKLPAALLHVQRCAVYTTLFSDAHGRVSARRAAQQRGRMAGGAQAPLLSSSSQQQQGQQQGRAASNSADLTDLTAAFEQSSNGEIAGDDAGAPVLPQPLPGQPLMFPSTPPPPHRPTGQPGSPATGAAAPAVPAAAVSLGLPAGHVSCGWLFHEGDMFHRPRLQAFLQQLWPHAARVKGIFRCDGTSTGAHAGSCEGLRVFLTCMHAYAGQMALPGVDGRDHTQMQLAQPGDHMQSIYMMRQRLAACNTSVLLCSRLPPASSPCDVGCVMIVSEGLLLTGLARHRMSSQS